MGPWRAFYYTAVIRTRNSSLLSSWSIGWTTTALQLSRGDEEIVDAVAAAR